jgi:hypothetical protein
VGPHRIDAGVVEQDVGAAEVGDRRRQCGDAGRVADIASHDGGLATVGFDLCPRRPGIGDVGDHDVRTFAGEPSRVGAPDALRRAGDHGRPPAMPVGGDHPGTSLGPQLRVDAGYLSC